MSGRKWTRAEVGILKCCVKNKMSSIDIAEVLDRGKEGVKRKVRSLGMHLHRSNKNRVDVLQRARLLDFLYENPGASLVEAGVAIGRTRETVGHMARLLVRDGLLKRTEGKRNYVRYVLAVKWNTRTSEVNSCPVR